MATTETYSRRDIFVRVREIIGKSRRIKLSFPLRLLNDSHRLKEHLRVEAVNDLIELLLGVEETFDIELPPEDVAKLEMTLGSGSIAFVDWQPGETATVGDLISCLQTILRDCPGSARPEPAWPEPNRKAKGEE